MSVREFRKDLDIIDSLQVEIIKLTRELVNVKPKKLCVSLELRDESLIFLDNKNRVEICEIILKNDLSLYLSTIIKLGNDKGLIKEYQEYRQEVQEALKIAKGGLK